MYHRIWRGCTRSHKRKWHELAEVTLARSLWTTCRNTNESETPVQPTASRPSRSSCQEIAPTPSCANCSHVVPSIARLHPRISVMHDLGTSENRKRSS